MTTTTEQQEDIPQRPWADTPLPLVKTPIYETGKSDAFTKGASHMALIHNAILRGFNSIYLQAPNVKESDYSDFVGYSLAWFKFVKKHHDDEELDLFPKVEELLGKEGEGLIDGIHEEHAAFMDGLVRFHDYLIPFGSGAQPKEQFSGKELVSIMDSFKDAFSHHFHSEISIIASWADLPIDPAIITLSPTTQGNIDTSEVHTAADLSPILGPVFQRWGKSTMMTASIIETVPVLFLNFDRTVEDGLWASWPPMPKVIRWLLVNVGGWWYKGWWKFASCDYDGMPRTLYTFSPDQQRAD